MSWSLVIWNIFVLGGCAYVVFGLDRSGWWFLFAVILLLKDGKKEMTK